MVKLYIIDNLLKNQCKSAQISVQMHFLAKSLQEMSKEFRPKKVRKHLRGIVHWE